MDAYTYNADLYCEDCIDDILRELKHRSNSGSWELGQEDTGDSNDYPQGPHSNGGGEADSPQHCGQCGTFLENPLTSYGDEYLLDSVAEFVHLGNGNPDTIREWAEFYCVTLSELLDRAATVLQNVETDEAPPNELGDEMRGMSSAID